MSSKVFFEGIPKDKREPLAEELAYRYPTWFFELWSEFDNKPLALEEYQIKYLIDPSTFKIVNKARQSGGSLMMAMHKFHRAYTLGGYECSIVSINLREAAKKIRDMRALHDTLPDKYKLPLTTDNATSIGFHTGAKKSIIEAIASSAAVRGGKKEIVLDEFAHIEKADEIYRAAAPAMMNGDLRLEAISTPRGNRNLFADIWWNQPVLRDGQYIRPYDSFTRHEFIWCDVRRFVTDYDAVQRKWYQVYKQDMSKMPKLIMEFGNDKLKAFYAQYPWEWFQQEFCGAFLDESSAFFPQALIDFCLRPPYDRNLPMSVQSETLDPWMRRPENNTNHVYMGVDYGESNEHSDKTSIQILERDGDILKHRYSEVLDARVYPTYPKQAEHIADIYHRFRPTKLSLDDTGVGSGVNPFLRQYLPHAPFDEVNFNFASKEQMVMNLKGLMEKGKIWLQQEDTQLQSQIRNMERKQTENSTRSTYHGKPHDDMFWALALAARQGAYKPFAITPLRRSARGSLL